MDVEKELEKMLTESELPEKDHRLEAVKQLSPRWIAVTPAPFHQVEEETKLLRKYVDEEEDKKLLGRDEK